MVVFLRSHHLVFLLFEIGSGADQVLTTCLPVSPRDPPPQPPLQYFRTKNIHLSTVKYLLNAFSEGLGMQ